VSSHKRLAKLSFACQNAGTARLTVQIGNRAWKSATKKYTCKQGTGKVNVALSKGVARKLRHPGSKVSASLQVTDGSTPSTLAVNLTGTKAKAAGSSDGVYWDYLQAPCEIQDNEGSIASAVPRPEVEPNQFPGGLMWFMWRSWLLYWDGSQHTWNVLAGVQDGYQSTQVWSYPSAGWLDEGKYLANSDYGSQHYSISPNHDVYTITAVQTYYEDINGQWYDGQMHFVHNSIATFAGSMVGPFCHFP
jgi:hypothetical protein